jgi:hypothetical protein
VTDRRTARGGPEAPTAESFVVAFATVAVAVIAAVVLQWNLQWSGDRNEALLLAALNLYLATQAAWFFNVRWRSLSDPVDRRVAVFIQACLAQNGVAPGIDLRPLGSVHTLHELQRQVGLHAAGFLNRRSGFVEAAERHCVHRHVDVTEIIVRKLGQQATGGVQSGFVIPQLPVCLRQGVVDDGRDRAQRVEPLGT